MLRAPLLARCDCCGLPIAPEMGENCPRCNYPIDAEKEERFLVASLHDLQRVATYGGAHLTLEKLLYRYQSRLNLLLRLQATSNNAEGTHQFVSPAPHTMPTLQRDRAQQTPFPASTTAQREPAKPRAAFTFSLKAFVVEQAITIIGLLGAFLILMGALSGVVTTSNRLVSFIIVFAVHVFFGVAGVIAYRFANFRLIARIYVGIYTFLVPLVGFTAYSLIRGNYIQVSVPMLIAVASVYAAIVYCLLAVYQRFPLFAYLGGMALIIADLAFAQNLQLGYWWWPSMLMLLALPAIAALNYTRRAGGQFFAGDRVVLRTPLRTFMYIIIGICVCAIVLTTLFALPLGDGTLQTHFLFNGVSYSFSEVRFAILSMTILLLLWTSLAFWFSRRTTHLLVLSYELLACVLASCYAFNASVDGYVLALTGIALLYHGLSRFAPRLLNPYGNLDVRLDQLALLLVSTVPLIGALRVPYQLYGAAFHRIVDIPAALLQQGRANFLVELSAIALGCLLTISVALYRQKLQGNASGVVQQSGQPVFWSWLLLVAGYLLMWGYGLVVLALRVEPVWGFLGLSIALTALAIVARQRFGKTWASPLEVVTLSALAYTLFLSLGLAPATRSTLLLCVAVGLYVIMLVQRRYQWLTLPFVCALAAVPDLLILPMPETLLFAIILPLLAVGVRRFMPHTMPVTRKNAAEPVAVAVLWELPLLGFGLLCGFIVSAHDVLFTSTVVYNALHLPYPVALEMATLAFVWYASAALARVRWWLLPVIAFAVEAVLWSANDFWVMVTVTTVAAVLAVLVSRRFARTWAMPLYTVALLSALLSGFAGYAGHLLAASWILPGFGLLAYAIGLLEGATFCLWLLPLFVTWSVVDAAGLGDLYRLPTAALAFAALGMVSGFLQRIPLPFNLITLRNRRPGYALPIYVTSLAAAILTGSFGMLHGVNAPFFGAIPDALLLYGCVAFAVAYIERRPHWLWLVAGFALWGTLIAGQSSLYYSASIALGTGILGLLAGRVIQRAMPVNTFPLKFNWGWPWYLTSIVAMGATIVWAQLSSPLPFANFLSYSLLTFIALTIVIMLVERVAEVVVLSSLLAALAIWFWQPHLVLVPLMLAYTLLCVLIFASQMLWKVLPPTSQWFPARSLHTTLGLAGQLLIVLTIIANNGLSTAGGQLPFVGAGTLFVLALLLFWYGRLQRDPAQQPTTNMHQSTPNGYQSTANVQQPTSNIHQSTANVYQSTANAQQPTANVHQSIANVQRCCDYGAGLLLAFVISWLLLAFQQSNAALLCLPPATYCILIAALLLRDESLPYHQRIGQFAALLGAVLLLLPTLWLSFTNGDANLLYTLLVMGEALVLLVLGTAIGLRVFVLTGAGLIVVGALRAIFLPSMGMPTYLVLTILGVIALALATILSLFGRRLQVAWKHWD